MRILLVEPGLAPNAVELESSLASMQKVVGGCIQAIYPFEEPIALVANEEGKLLGLPLNRALRMPESDEVYDIIAGTFFLCATPPDSESFESLSEEQIQRYRKRFQTLEQFLVLNGQLLVLPLPVEDSHA